MSGGDAFARGKAEGAKPDGFAGSCPYSRENQQVDFEGWMEGFSAGRIEAGSGAKPDLQAREHPTGERQAIQD